MELGEFQPYQCEVRWSYSRGYQAPLVVITSRCFVLYEKLRKIYSSGINGLKLNTKSALGVVLLRMTEVDRILIHEYCKILAFLAENTDDGSNYVGPNYQSGSPSSSGSNHQQLGPPSSSGSNHQQSGSISGATLPSGQYNDNQRSQGNNQSHKPSIKSGSDSTANNSKEGQ